MKILIISQYFYPESGAASARAYFFAKYLKSFGHEVTVLCASPNYPHGNIYDGYKNARREEYVDGIRVKRTLIFPTKYTGALRRFLNYLSFSASSSTELFRNEDYDVVLASSPPIFVFAIGLLAKKLKKSPLVVDIRDVWPGVLVDTGSLKFGPAISILEALEGRAYKSASKIATVNEETKDLILRNNSFLDSKKLDVVFNGVDVESFDKLVEKKAKFSVNKNSNEIMFAYLGTIGEQQSILTFGQAIKLVSKRAPDIRFIIIGDGSKKESLVDALKDLKNVQIEGSMKYEEVLPILKNIDVGLVLVRKSRYLDNTYPVKSFDYMAAGKPILVSGSLAMKSLIDKEKFGFWVPAEEPEALASKIVEISKMPKETLEEMGNRGRKLVEGQFNREKQAQKLEKILKEIVKKRENGP